MILSMICVSFMWAIGLSLAIHNLKRCRKDELEARRAYKRQKIENLRKILKK